ncbi:MAG: hypothetical protein JEZ02_10605 [Desulfatibacillum sp.]|nr:hypothetical protein [Desulfatibacillum sp.]
MEEDTEFEELEDMEELESLEDDLELLPICMNCNQFLPDTMAGPTEYGICIRDDLWEPYLDALLEAPHLAPCQDLIAQNRFLGERDVCDHFEPLEVVDVASDSLLGIALQIFEETGHMDLELLEQLKKWAEEPSD